MRYCKYRDLLGKPNEGIHSYRIMDIAIVDVILTFLLAKILQNTSNNLLGLNHTYVVYLFGLFVLGIVLHRIFCVRTTIDKLLF